jgi:hypothetical protein
MAVVDTEVADTMEVEALVVAASEGLVFGETE